MPSRRPARPRPRRAAACRAPPAASGFGSRDAGDDARDARGDDRVGARRRRPVVRARLERDVHRRAPRALARLGQRDRLGVAPARLSDALGDDDAVAHEDRADGRLRMRPLVGGARDLDRALEAHRIACSSPRYAATGSAAAKIDDAGDEERHALVAQPPDVVGARRRRRPGCALLPGAASATRARARTSAPGTPGPSSRGGSTCRARGRRRPRRRRPSAGSLSGLNASPTPRPVLSRGGDRRRDVVDRLEVEGHAVAARLRERLEVLRRMLDHQVHVDSRAGAVDPLGDRLQDDRPHRDRLDEMAVADVEVEDVHAGIEQLVDLLSEPREIGPVQRRLDLDLTRPVRPAHRRDRRATKPSAAGR